jgi:type I restriction enzyme S subunit
MKQGWEEIKMVDVCEILTCGVASTPTYVDKQIGVPFLSAQNVRDGEVVLEKYSFISKEFHQKLTSKNKPSKGDILYSRVGAKYGEAGVVEHSFEFSVYVSVTLIRPKRELLNNYFLKYYLNSPRIKDLAKKSISSSGVPNLNVNSVRDFLVPIPPLTEQQSIVTILNEAFTTIAKAKVNAEQNLKNAAALFESYLQGVFENGNWETKTIQEITKVINGYAFASKDFKSTNTIKSIKITNVGVKKFVEEVDNYLPEKFKDTLKEVQVKEGNIVIALTRTIISAGLKVAVVPESYEGALVNQRVAALVANEKIVNQRYLYNYLTTDGVAKYVLAHVNTLMQPNLSINDLKNLPVPCPSLIEQQNIVQKLDALSTETKKLEAIYQQKISDLEELKKSVLQKAFSGELKTETETETVIL